MQNADAQTQTTAFTLPPGRVGDASKWEGCISKKELSTILRPHRSYRSDVVRVFFTTERLERCGIAPDEFRRIRVFSVEATHIIVSDLVKFGFIR